MSKFRKHWRVTSSRKLRNYIVANCSVPLWNKFDFKYISYESTSRRFVHQWEALVRYSLVTGHCEISLNPFDIATTQLTSSPANCQYPEVAAGGAPHRDGDVLGGGGDLDRGPHFSVHHELTTVGTFFCVAGVCLGCISRTLGSSVCRYRIVTLSCSCLVPSSTGCTAGREGAPGPPTTIDC